MEVLANYLVYRDHDRFWYRFPNMNGLYVDLNGFYCKLHFYNTNRDGFKNVDKVMSSPNIKEKILVLARTWGGITLERMPVKRFMD